ncbi:MAG: glycosyltransferase family 4 protein, partial [Chloroflexota bacterium]|nr:glycosyltransferase family 4 protein [Chloroflexota bacterium]
LVIPNGIDTRRATPDRVAPATPMRETAAPALVFTGKMDFRPNVDGVLWFVDEILPLIPHDGSRPTLWVVGQEPHPLLGRLREHPQVVLTGWVDAIEPYLAAADVVVVPLRMGSGTRLKVLQALSLERPVVSTTLGSAGLGLEDNVHLRIADDTATFATMIHDLLHNPTDAAAMARLGGAYVREQFDWQVLVPRLEQAYVEQGFAEIKDR